VKRYRVPISGGELATVILPWEACLSDLDYLAAWLARYRTALENPKPEERP
jgi:hypothetical protein